MICKKCGQQLSENALTCDACGAVVKVCQPERRRQHLLTGGLVLAGAIALGAVMGLAGKKLTPDPAESASAETGPEASQAPTEETRTPTQEQAQQTGSTEIVTMYLPETVTYHDESGNSAGFYIKYTYESDWKTKDYLAYDTFVCLDAGASYRMTHEVCQDKIITYDPDTGEEESCQKNTWDSCGNLTQEEYYENGKLVETKVYAYKGVKVPMYLAERYPMFNRKQG